MNKRPLTSSEILALETIMYSAEFLINNDAIRDEIIFSPEEYCNLYNIYDTVKEKLNKK